MLGAKQGQDVYLAGRLLPLFLAPHKQGIVNVLIIVSIFLIVMIAIDSIPAVYIVAPEWF